LTKCALSALTLISRYITQKSTFTTCRSQQWPWTPASESRFTLGSYRGRTHTPCKIHVALRFSRTADSSKSILGQARRGLASNIS
jgi:hypothetical protein